MLLNRDDESIIAQCTPHGKGALALIRVSGNNARLIVHNFAQLPSGKTIKDVPSHSVHYGFIIDAEGNHIDQVMFIVMDGPKTFTGQNSIEITCHNNPFLIEAIINQAIKNGARMAQEGEFAKRAFINGKIDLLQAEAINELIHANTQLALKKSLAQLEGSFSHWMNTLQQELIRTLAWCEASFEFLDEEKEFGNHIKIHLETILQKIATLKNTFDAQQHIRQGIKIALIGSVNAGKSSIFNTLLNQKRSIVTDIAGTTRDTVEAGIYRNGNYWTLIDTAGIRQTSDVIEQEGIQRSFDEAHKADIILLVWDSTRLLTKEESTIYNDIMHTYAQKIILVHNKADLPAQYNHFLSLPSIAFSSKTKEGILLLEQSIEEKITRLFSTIESPFLLNQRQYKLLLGLESKLNSIIPMLTHTIHYELVSYHLHDALEYMSELTGKSVSEEGLDRVFKEFCVGK